MPDLSRRFADAVLAFLVPVCVYLPLIVANAQFQRNGLPSPVGDAVWVLIWVGSVAGGYWMFARRLGPPLPIAIIYIPAMLALLGYFGLVTGLFLYGDGP